MKRIIITLSLVLAILAFGQINNKTGGEVRFSPRLLNYQGFLTDTLSNPINGSYDILFRVYDDPVAGNMLWSENQIAVPIAKGIFHILLGSVTSIPDSIFTKSANRWLALRISSQDLSPRTRIVSAPYAYTATMSDTAFYAKNSAPDNDWTYRITEGADTTLQMNGRWGLARIGNVLIGNNDSTHVNLGVACTTGTALQAYKYCVVSGGYRNIAGKTGSTVAGGRSNLASSDFATVGGGRFNAASASDATVSGGSDNNASGFFSSVSGGYSDTASGNFAVVCGGDRNRAIGTYSIVSGGQFNKASGEQATVSGGNNNIASETLSTVGGGLYNTASGYIATVAGGNDNTASGRYATVGGGYFSSAKAVYGGVGSGDGNHAGDSLLDTAAVVAGGSSNAALAPYSSIGGGCSNYVGGYAAGVGGGYNNSANDSFGYVGGGKENNSAGIYSAILGGYSNTIFVTGDYSYLFGINSDLYSDSTFMVDMPHVWFGTEANGYEFPRSRGTNGQVMVTNGVGQLSWSNAPVDNDWAYRVTDGADTTLQTGGRWGLARAGNALYGTADSTHVNLGVACTTGVSGQNYKYCVVGGGRYNRATNVLSTVGGGDGNQASGGVSTIGGGSNCTASGGYATIAGGSINTAAGEISVVAGGVNNSALGYSSAIGGGSDNNAAGDYAAVSGGQYNIANANNSTVGGGRNSYAGGDYSAILGGYADTITATGDYSYLFGINSNLTQDSTFMVDMPHVWFGTEANGYAFPRNRGTNGQVMVTDGSGVLAWGGINYVDSARVAANSHKLQGKDTVTLDARWVNEGQVNAVANAMIQDAAVTMSKINQSGATAGQVIKWNGAAWQPAADSFRDNDWTFSISDGADTSLQVGGRWGLTRPGNVMLGNTDSTHVNFGYACTTGNNSMNRKYITISGGYSNWAYGDYASIGGGRDNWAMTYATVAGGVCDTAGNTYSAVGGGYANVADGASAVIAGGEYNMASGAVSIVGGGDHNLADSNNAVISGGSDNTASGAGSTVGGGENNTASRRASTVSGGASNTAASVYSVVGGGLQNTASNEYATVGGGIGDTASGYYSSVGGGQHNHAGDYWTTVGGGYANYASNNYATVPGGRADTASALYSFATNNNSTAGFSNSAAFNGETSTASGQTRVGTLSKAGGSFTIDHPLDPENKILNHYFVESPDMSNMYSGSVVLDKEGRAKVDLPDYFDALNKNPRVQLTGVGSSDVYVAEDIQANRFAIGGKPSMKVYWTVIADRKDPSAEIIRNIMPVEQVKEGVLAGRSLDDEFLVVTREQLESMGKADGFRFRHAAEQARYEEMKRDSR